MNPKKPSMTFLTDFVLFFYFTVPSQTATPGRHANFLIDMTPCSDEKTNKNGISESATMPKPGNRGKHPQSESGAICFIWRPVRRSHCSDRKHTLKKMTLLTNLIQL